MSIQGLHWMASSLSTPPATDVLVCVASTVEIPCGRDGTTARFCSFDGFKDGSEHLLIIFGAPDNTLAPLVRLHSECLTGDVFGSLRCDCGQQLSHAIGILNEQTGYLIYLRQEGRGIGLYNKLAAYRLQDQGLDTYQANAALGLEKDPRDYWPAAAMLKAVGVSTIRLLTNNPDKVRQLERSNIRVAERIGTPVYVNPYNRRYLLAKGAIGRHYLELPNERGASP
jgi:GTP cyclohydrolase II